MPWLTHLMTYYLLNGNDVLIWLLRQIRAIGSSATRNLFVWVLDCSIAHIYLRGRVGCRSVDADLFDFSLASSVKKI